MGGSTTLCASYHIYLGIHLFFKFATHPSHHFIYPTTTPCYSNILGWSWWSPNETIFPFITFCWWMNDEVCVTSDLFASSSPSPHYYRSIRLNAPPHVRGAQLWWSPTNPFNMPHAMRGGRIVIEWEPPSAYHSMSKTHSHKWQYRNPCQWKSYMHHQ